MTLISSNRAGSGQAGEAPDSPPAGAVEAERRDLVMQCQKMFRRTTKLDFVAAVV